MLTVIATAVAGVALATVTVIGVTSSADSTPSNAPSSTSSSGLDYGTGQ